MISEKGLENLKHKWKTAQQLANVFILVLEGLILMFQFRCIHFLKANYVNFNGTLNPHKTIFEAQLSNMKHVG